LLDLLRHRERCVGDLAGALGCTQANASKHLALLADAGLLKRRREGLNCYYSISDPSVFELCDAVFDGLCRHLDARTGALGEAV
jgi:DNA-binding transcriptional ArsR family regulator